MASTSDPPGTRANVVLRPATSSDIDRIVDAYNTSWRAGYAGLLSDRVLDELEPRRREHGWGSAIESSAAAVFVAASGPEVVGVVQADEHLPEPERDRPEITMMYVVPMAWGTPVAHNLLAAGSEWIAARGHAEGRLRVVEQQARARRFYEREGWLPDPEVPPAANDFFRLLYYRRRFVSDGRK